MVIFFSAFTAVLYHLGVLQPLVRLFARIFHRSMRISGAEALSGSSNIFMGAIIQGAMDGLKLAAGIAAVLIAVLFFRR